MKCLFTAALLLPAFALAQTSPVGLWKTIDDDGKTAKSLVRISEQGGTLVGTIDTCWTRKTLPTASATSAATIARTSPSWACRSSAA